MHTEQLQDETNLAPIKVYEGVIANTATDPSDNVYVRVPDLDDDPTHPSRLGPCRWEPRPAAGGPSYPEEDDICAVVKTHNGSYWILGFTPYA